MPITLASLCISRTSS